MLGRGKILYVWKHFLLTSFNKGAGCKHCK